MPPHGTSDIVLVSEAGEEAEKTLKQTQPFLLLVTGWAYCDV